MANLNDFLFQIFQPYFFYSVVFLSIAFVAIKIFLKFTSFVHSRSQSIIWLIPLLIPVTVLLLFHPSLIINPQLFIPQTLAPAGMGIADASSYPGFFSFTGLLCIGGVVAAVAYLGFMIVFGPRIALKRFHVVMMTPDEYTSLQERIKETAQKLSISEPKVGLIDDLLPNAFTVGHGRKTVLVFSLGLLNMLELDELNAVASHELAHVKARDYLFKTVSYALNILSFFNPLSYFALSQSQKQRELLADEKGAALLDKPHLLADVLTKVTAVVEEFPKPDFAERLSSSLFLVSPLAHRPSILSSHPQIAQRVRNIHGDAFVSSKKPHRIVITALLLCIVVCASLLAGFSVVAAQEAFNQKQITAIADTGSFYLYNVSLPFDSAHPTGIFFANKSDLEYFIEAITVDQPVGNLIGIMDGYVMTTGYNDNCYLDGNGVVHNFTQYPNIGSVVVNGWSVVVNGQRPYVGNISYPFDLSHLTNIFLANQSDPSQPEAIGYIDGNGGSHVFQSPIIGVYFNTEITLPDSTITNGQCAPIYALSSYNSTNIFGQTVEWLDA
jgi:Zn-dependent protease with chaperone function